MSHASVLTWPGPPPCDAGLQACINAANSSDTVRVQSSSTIDLGGNLLVQKPINLAAAPGFRPALAPGQTILALCNPGAGVAWSLDIEGFTITDGGVVVEANSGDATITLRHLEVTTSTPVIDIGSGIGIRNNSAGTMQFEVADSLVRVATSGIMQPTGIFADDTGGGNITGTIHDNRINGDLGTQMRGLVVQTAGTSSVRAYANQVSGSIGSGIVLSPGNANVAFVGTVVSNAVRCSSAGGTGMLASGVFAGSGEAQYLNNTIVGCGTAFNINSGASLGGRFANNLVAYNNLGLNIPAANAAAFTNDHNLLFANGSNNFTAGPSTLTGDPLLLRGKDDPRPGSGSPAIDAADSAALQTLLADAAIPEVDADGLRRFKGAANVADIGAFEFGDTALIELATAGNGGVIDGPALNGNASALPQLVQDATPDTYLASATDPAEAGLEYTGENFGVIDETSGGAPVAGSGWNVFVPGMGAGAFTHASSGSNVLGFTSEIDDAYVNSRPDRILLATHRAAPLFDHPAGLVYSAGHWFLQQLDAQAGGSDFPSGIIFHMYAQDPSLNAFVWMAPFTGASTVIDHPLLNAEPCGRLYVSSGNLDPHPFNVAYSQGRWTIANSDGAPIPSGAAFSVVVDEHAIEFCRYDHLFHDGFP